MTMNKDKYKKKLLLGKKFNIEFSSDAGFST